MALLTDWGEAVGRVRRYRPYALVMVCCAASSSGTDSCRARRRG